jgi:hypothetical protein
MDDREGEGDPIVRSVCGRVLWATGASAILSDSETLRKKFISLAGAEAQGSRRDHSHHLG